MPAREIVRDANTLGGRWHFADTTITVAAVRIDHGQNSSEDGAGYHYMNLSEEEIANALAFDFPPIRESRLDVNYASVTMHCECGEETPRVTTWPDEFHVGCPCGRTWLVKVTFHLLTKRGPARMD